MGIGLIQNLAAEPWKPRAVALFAAQAPLPRLPGVRFWDKLEVKKTSLNCQLTGMIGADTITVS